MNTRNWIMAHRMSHRDSLERIVILEMLLCFVLGFGVEGEAAHL